MTYVLIMCSFIGIPITSILFWIISIVRYVDAKKKNLDEEMLKNRKTMLVISSTIMGMLLAVVVGFVILMYMAVAFM